MPIFDWSDLISLVALGLSAITLNNQYFKTEVIVYPKVKDRRFYLCIQNTGQTIATDFTIKILEIDTLLNEMKKMPDEQKESFKKRNGLTGKSKNIMAANSFRDIPLGSEGNFVVVEEVNEDYEVLYPVFKVEVKTKRKFLKSLYKKKVFNCDFNIYHQEEVDFSTSHHVDNIGKTLKKIEKKISEKSL